MPYLRLYVPRGKSESEAQAILNYLRDNFPLEQSEGRVLRVAPTLSCSSSLNIQA